MRMVTVKEALEAQAKDCAKDCAKDFHRGHNLKEVTKGLEKGT
jgi:hypothetical protein